MRRCFETQPFYGVVSFREDFDLMVANACAFNMPGDPVHHMALDLSTKFEALRKAEQQQRAPQQQKRSRVG
jgi:hypothetical protein